MRVVALVASLLFSGALLAQGYPAKPIRIVDASPSASPEAFAAEIRAEAPMWERVIRESGAKVE
ncbi:MAG: hypothetical protein ACRD3R_15500 [Terriglobales bacterium]